MLLPFDGPVDSQLDWTMCRKGDEGLQPNGVCQMPWRQTLVVEQARQPLRRSFLIAKVTSQLGLTAGLLSNNRLHKVPDGFALMAMCSGQYIHDIIVETSSRRVLSFHIPRLA